MGEVAQESADRSLATLQEATASQEGEEQRMSRAKTNISVLLVEYPQWVCPSGCVCERSDMAAYSYLKMASIFLSQQNGDCKIVALAMLRRR